MINEKGVAVYLKKKAVELEWERKLFHDLQKKGDNVISQIFDKPPPPLPWALTPLPWEFVVEATDWKILLIPAASGFTFSPNKEEY